MPRWPEEERTRVGLGCGHSMTVSREQAARGRAYCGECRATKVIRGTAGGKCEHCGRPKNRYNTGPNCGPCDMSERRSA
jgi:hypothetical protein